MVFNWFNRQNQDADQIDSEEKEKEIPAVSESPGESATTTTTETTPEVATDLLAFAKAAYKNIQDKQESQSPAEDTLIDEPASPATEPEIEAKSTDNVSPTQLETESIQSEAVVVNVTDTTTTETAEEVADVPVEESAEKEANTQIPETNSELSQSQPATPANLSFLERAAAEQQAKQERLIASAIEIEEPQEAQNSSDTQNEEIPLIAFDDGFLWSAEVLAAQGRRPEDISIEEITWLKRLRQGLDKTRRNIVNQLKAIVGQGPLNQAAVEEIEAALLQADVGVEATDYIIQALQQKLREQALPPEEAIAYLKQLLRDLLNKPLEESASAFLGPEKETLNIWLITGVNGAGKTTTIGKLAHLAHKSGYKCLIGAADTFRAAAVEQVKVWGTRSGVEVIANPGKNTDPAAVVFDAIAAAQSRNTELLLVDTAGRLQNKKNLMEELSKIRRIINKKAPNAKVESLLVLDATLGQNGLRQAEVFSQAAQLSGVVLTKLDSTAKGGVALAVVQQLNLPIRFIGAGEGIEDLRPFSTYEFIEALLSG
ncbi:signal recognition particle-docking protein FtsY [Calothrix rhizosoleniae]|uniref:signal recognition particle-docking protein FtsY n=1 Tax=Calothrix rhizosoleniae TaxID=888997 RepID=UPI000B4A3652|nr:signal recognition particle-docking protein FtsY [Calothrix rhizosoleniae]